jgi:type VI secretion system protein ImpA
MATPPVLDLTLLLQPIAGASPAGQDLRQDKTPASLYLRVKDARSAARTAERTVASEGGESAQPTAAPDWDVVQSLALEVLTQKSKDLEILAWLCEAMVRLQGFAGLRDCFHVAAGLIETMWDALYPLPDEEGVAGRVAPFTGLNGEEGDGTLIAPISAVAITQGMSSGPYATWQYMQAIEIEKIVDPEKKARRLESAGAVALDTIRRVAVETPQEFVQATREDLQQALQQFERLGKAFDARCADQAPPTANIRNALQVCLDALQVLAPAEGAAPAAADAAGGGQPAAASKGPGGKVTRDEAFRQLLEVANFFRRAEPHSPVSYALEQAVRWGRMPLPDLLSELIPDSGARDFYFKLAGIKPPEEPAKQ